MKNKFNNKLNIEELKQELQNIVLDYNDIDNSNNFHSHQKNNSLSSLEEENRQLSIKINNTKERIYEKLSSLSGKNKFQHLLNKFVEFYDEKDLNKLKVASKFENYVNDEFSSSSNLDTSTLNSSSSSLDKSYTQDIENLFEEQIKEIRDIQKNKARFIDEIIYDLNPNDVTHEVVTTSVINKLDYINKDFKLDLNYYSSKYSSLNNKNSSDLIKFKENILNLINDSIEELKEEFKNYIMFNKFLHEKISSINGENQKINLDDSPTSKRSFAINDDKYSSLEDKILKLIDSVDNLATKNNNFENKTTEIIDKKINDLEEKFNKMINSLVEQNENKLYLEQENSNKIFEKLSNFVDSIKTEKNDFIMQAQKQIVDIVKNNENEKKTIIELLQKIQSETISASDAEAYNRSLVNSNKLVQLESLIMRQNDEIEELLKEKNDAFDVLEDILNNPQGKNDPEELLSHIESNIERIIYNFDEKISNLEQSFVDKLEAMNSRENSDRNDLIDNISDVENRLLQNYETIKMNFSDSFNEIINWLNSNRDTGTKLDELLNNVRDIKHGTHQFGLGNDIKNELSNLLESNKSSLIQQYGPLEDKIESLTSAFKENKNDIQNKTSEIINSRISELENKFTSLVDVINESNANKLNIEQENSDRLYDKLAQLVNSINYEKNEFFLETKQQITSIIKSNENEKKYIISLLNKIQDDNKSTNDEVALNRSLINSEKLLQLEHLIMRQNQELEELLNDKNEAFDTIHEMLSKTTKNDDVTQSSFMEIEDNVTSIVKSLEDKINGLEQTFVSQLDAINSNMAASLMNNASNYNDNKSLNEMMNNINSVEQKLIQNYDYIKQNFNESFNEIINRLNSTKDSIFNDSEINSKLDSIISDIDSIKYSSKYGLGDNLKSELRDIFSVELNNKISELINNGINAEELNNKIGHIERKLNDLTEEIIDRNKHEFIELSNKIDSVDYITKLISEKVLSLDDEYENVEAKLFDNFKKYEEVLTNTLLKDKENYNELKQMIEENYVKRENELSESEFSKLQSLNLKLEKLASLIDMQEREIETLIQEKNEVMSWVGNASPNDLKFNSNEIDQLSQVVASKVQECLKRNLSTPDNITSIYKSDDYNELVQMNEKIDELSNYLHNNMGFFQDKNSISELFSVDVFQNFSNIDFLIKKVEFITSEINNIHFELSTSESQKLGEIQDKLDSLKFNLFSIEWDLSLLKHKLDASLQIQDMDVENRHKDLILANKKKLEIISDLIDKNKKALSNLFNDKENLIKKYKLNNNLSSNNDYDSDILVDIKSNAIFDKLVNKLKTTFNNEIDLLNSKFINLQAKILDSYSNKNRDDQNLVDDFNEEDIKTINEIISKISILEENLERAFDALENKNKELLNGITSLVSENYVYKQIVDKFDKQKGLIQEEYDKQKENFKDYILNLKNTEIQGYKDKLNKLEKEVNKLRELNEKEIFDQLDSLDNYIEMLMLQLNSFQEEKHILYNEMIDKLNYVDKLGNPTSSDEFISLETDNMYSGKFKDIVGKDTIRVIEEKFDTLKENLIVDLNKIITEINELKEKWLSDDTKLQKMNKNSDSPLKLINDNVLFFIDELERRKSEISLFYKKINNLKEIVER